MDTIKRLITTHPRGAKQQRDILYYRVTITDGKRVVATETCGANIHHANALADRLQARCQ